MKRPQRRFTEHKATGHPLALSLDHTAVMTSMPLFPSRIVYDDHKPLKPGAYQRKIGSHVVKGAWSGMPIYCLTLPERATCPRTCVHWRDCYGNKMHWSRRHAPGPALEFALRAQVSELAAKHPGGFVVRLHILGDFYSLAYAALWHDLLDRYPALRVFGYTARDPAKAIGEALCRVASKHRARWVVRFSNGSPLTIEAHSRTVSIDTAEDCPGDAVICPAQTNKTDCCGTCALCWSTTKAIAFLRH